VTDSGAQEVEIMSAAPEPPPAPEAGLEGAEARSGREDERPDTLAAVASGTNDIVERPPEALHVLPRVA
jgi:hypothetical protein